MSTPLYLIATIHPRAEHRELVMTALAALITASQAEDGCEMYDLVQGEGEDVLVMMEKWSSREQWDAHMLSEHVRAMNALDKACFTRETDLRFLHPAQ
jgi:quinol monooxygenase YgiN